MPFQHMKGFIGTLFFQTVRRACICKLTYLQIFIWKPQIQTCGALVVIHGHVQSVKKFFTCHTCSQLSLTRQHCLLASNAVNKCSFHGQFSFTFFFCVCAFCWLFHCFKWPPRVMLKGWIVFESTGRLGAPYRGNTCVRPASFTHAL